MRIIWVKVGGLWPLNTGGRVRSFQIVSELSQKHQVTVLTTHDPADGVNELALRLAACERVISVPYSLPKRGTARFATALIQSWFTSYPVDVWKCRVHDLRRAVAGMMARASFDVCVIDFLAAILNVPRPAPTPTVFFAHNVEHVIWKRLARTGGPVWRRLMLELEWRKLRRIEAEACAAASVTVAVSESDAALLGRVAPAARIRAIPTGVDVEYFRPDHLNEAATTLVFTGAMDWYPNEDAILFFIDSILPAIRVEVPSTSVLVVGRNPTARLRRAAAQAGVEVTGTVEDVRPYIARAAVYIVPLRIGGGTRLKIFEALAMRKAIVATSIGAEGLPLADRKHFLCADDPTEFARAVVSLLRDPVLRQSLGVAGRRLVEERYSWRQVSLEFEARCREVCEPTHAS